MIVIIVYLVVDMVDIFGIVVPVVVCVVGLTSR